MERGVCDESLCGDSEGEQSERHSDKSSGRVSRTSPDTNGKTNVLETLEEEGDREPLRNCELFSKSLKSTRKGSWMSVGTSGTAESVRGVQGEGVREAGSSGRVGGGRESISGTVGGGRESISGLSSERSECRRRSVSEEVRSVSVSVSVPGGCCPVKKSESVSVCVCETVCVSVCVCANKGRIRSQRKCTRSVEVSP